MLQQYEKARVEAAERNRYAEGYREGYAEGFENGKAGKQFNIAKELQTDI